MVRALRLAAMSGILAATAADIAAGTASIATGGGIIAAGQTPAAQPAPRAVALVVTYADGRVTESVVGAAGFRAWTPMFPRVSDWREPRGVPPVTALNIRATLNGQIVRVAVSVLRGRARDVEQAIATVEVDGSAPVVVEDLRLVALRPVAFTLEPFASPALHVPRMASRVGGLVVDAIEPVTDPVPAYRITIRNTTDVPAITVAYDTFAAGAPALSGQQGDPTAVPVVPPGETFTFRLGLTGGRTTGQSFATATPLDDVILTGAIWADGRVSGDSDRVAPLLALHRGRLTALTSVVATMKSEVLRRDADAIAALGRVKDALARVPSAADAMAVATVMRLVPGMSPYAAEGVAPAVSIGSQNVRQRLLENLDRVLPGITAAQARQWLGEALPACEAWLARLHALFPTR